MRTILLALLALPLPALAQDEDGGGGTLNPEELSLSRVLSDTDQGIVSMPNCAMGYMITKSGRHAEAREVFELCAAAGYTGAMTWMSQLDDNGLGAPEDPAAAAEWDRMAAEAGDPVGLFNYGLDKMRGRGTALDEAGGRALIDRAAEAGLPTAKRLQEAEYDLDEVTPDADNWKYGERLF
ncbi:sel1 repeat family protein [Neotabrizicola sp. sgz301269]|uniref:sel1 repeat family protein n=1 Tax=Neotabrizicola sp. sgz301269 TaxID=3276282 RepID=UPI00376FB6F2